VGEAVEVKPGASRSQETGFTEPGQWRLAARYGLGCKKGHAMNAKHCASLHHVLSTAVTVKVDKQTCEELDRQYRAALEPAKKCNPWINTVQCREKVNSGLACGCPLFVQATKHLNELSQKWSAWMCPQLVTPCSVKCTPPAPAYCGKDGRCTTGR